MKKILSGSCGIFFLLLLFFSAGELFSQTTGTFSFSVTTTAPSGSYADENLLAIWIESGAPASAFIKTKIRYCSNGNLDHLNTWVTKSGQNVVDAVTGATRTSHGTVTFLWNGTSTNGTVVADGAYLVRLEMAWDRDMSTGKTVNSFPFTKGTSLFHSNPANTGNFLSLVLD